MSRRATRSACALALGAMTLLGVGCTTTGDSSVSFYGSAFYYDDPWYWDGCCVDRPDSIGPPPPRPSHPIANVPPARPANPIADTPAPRPSNPIASGGATPMPRSGGMRGGGGFGGGGGRGGGGRR